MSGAELVRWWSAGVVLVARQLARPAPLLPVDLLRIPLFALSVATSVCALHRPSRWRWSSLPFLFENTLGFDARWRPGC